MTQVLLGIATILSFIAFSVMVAGALYAAFTIAEKSS